MLRLVVQTPLPQIDGRPHHGYSYTLLVELAGCFPGNNPACKICNRRAGHPCWMAGRV